MKNVTVSSYAKGKESTEVNIGDVTIWFSYKTPIAFKVPGLDRVVRKNEWGPTTGKHLNAIDRGAVALRVDGSKFEAMLTEHILSKFKLA